MFEPSAKTAYALALARCGFSHSEAALVHGVRLDTVKSWSSGRNPVPQGVWDELRQLERTRRVLVETLDVARVQSHNGEISHQLQAGVDPMLVAMLALRTPVGVSVAAQRAKQDRADG